MNTNQTPSQTRTDDHAQNERAPIRDGRNEAQVSDADEATRRANYTAIPPVAPVPESAKRQRAKIEAHFLLHGSLTTLEARNQLGVMHPAARVQELRESGHRIITVWTRQRDTTGRRHRVARYHWRGLDLGGSGDGNE